MNSDKLALCVPGLFLYDCREVNKNMFTKSNYRF